jgi:hypothetical protein
VRPGAVDEAHRQAAANKLALDVAAIGRVDVPQEPAVAVDVALAGFGTQDHAGGGAAGDVLLGLLGQRCLPRAACPAVGR